MHFLPTLAWLLFALGPATDAFPTGFDDQINSLDVRGSKNRHITCGQYSVTIFPGRVGEGGLGKVYKGEIPNRDKKPTPVAVKELHHRSSSQLDAYATVIGVRHPNMMNVYATCSTGGKHYIVTEWVPGHEIASYIRAGFFNVQGRTGTVLKKWATGLRDMHQAGLAHADIKPGNVMATSDLAEVVIIDYDLLTRKDRDTSRCGTPPYMSPELWYQGNKGFPYHDPKMDDVWALGVSIIEIVTGQRPWADPTGRAYEIYQLHGDERAKKLKKKYAISWQLADLLGEVFKPQERRISMARLKTKLHAIDRFHPEQPRRAAIEARQEPAPEANPATVCLAPHNGTMFH